MMEMTFEIHGAVCHTCRQELHSTAHAVALAFLIAFRDMHCLHDGFAWKVTVPDHPRMIELRFGADGSLTMREAVDCESVKM
jgi:hypothetical protein